MIRLLVAVLLGGTDGFLIAQGVFHLTNSLIAEAAVGLPLAFVSAFLLGRGLARS